MLDTQFCQLRDALNNTAYNGAFDVALSPAVTNCAAWRKCPIAVDDFNSDDNSLRAMLLSVSGVPWQQQRDIQHHASGGPGELSHQCLPGTATYLTVGNNGTAQAFQYQITVTSGGRPRQVRAASPANSTVRPEIVRIVAAIPAPAYGNAGTSFTPTARRCQQSTNCVRSACATSCATANNVLRYSLATRRGIVRERRQGEGRTARQFRQYPASATACIALMSPPTTLIARLPAQPAAATSWWATVRGHADSRPPARRPATAPSMSWPLDRSLVAQPNLQLRSTAITGGRRRLPETATISTPVRTTASIINVSNPSAPALSGSSVRTILATPTRTWIARP